jgi:hypothetical protein
VWFASRDQINKERERASHYFKKMDINQAAKVGSVERI